MLFSPSILFIASRTYIFSFSTPTITYVTKALWNPHGWPLSYLSEQDKVKYIMKQHCFPFKSILSLPQPLGMDSGFMAHTQSHGPFLIKKNNSNIQSPFPKIKLSQAPVLLRGSSLQSSIKLVIGKAGLKLSLSS